MPAAIQLNTAPMPEQKLLLRFRVLFTDDRGYGPDEPNGPLFSRWLPNGEQDSVEVPTGDPKVSLRLYLERCGFVGDGFIRFDYRRREVDPAVMVRQSPLNGGPLRGLLELRDVPNDVLAALRADQRDDGVYRAFGKRVVNTFLYPLVSRFIAVLRTNSGQFWLRDLHSWDSRDESLGEYCRGLRLAWSEDEGKEWRDFRPDEPQAIFTTRRGSGLLTEADWLELKKAIASGYEPSTAARLVGRAHEILESGDLRYAAAEAVSALEVGLADLIRSRMEPGTAEKIAAFWNLSVTAQLATAAALVGGLDQDQLRLAFQAIEIRNRVVHEGAMPAPSSAEAIRALLRVAAHFIGGPRFMFPTLPSGRALAPESPTK